MRGEATIANVAWYLRFRHQRSSNQSPDAHRLRVKEIVALLVWCRVSAGFCRRIFVAICVFPAAAATNAGAFGPFCGLGNPGPRICRHCQVHGSQRLSLGRRKRISFQKTTPRVVPQKPTLPTQRDDVHIRHQTFFFFLFRELPCVIVVPQMCSETALKVESAAIPRFQSDILCRYSA